MEGSKKLIERLRIDDQLLKNGGFIKKRYNFSQVSNVILDDESIAIDTKGLYSIIQRWITYYENSQLDKEFLRKKASVGINKFDRMWDELKKFGYLKQYRISCGESRFVYVYELLDEPDLTNISTVTLSISEFNLQQNS